jgi:hypothetical protein
MSKIKIQIKNMRGKDTLLEVDPSEKIVDAKNRSGQGENIQWKFNGEVLKNNNPFDSYSIEDDDVIVSNFRSKGGNN